MLSKTIQDAFNDQLNFEIYSANIYLSMASWFDERNLKGFSNWMKIQYKEEISHTTQFYNHIDERGGRVIIQAHPAPETQWDSPQATFENALAHERIVTGRINDLISLAAGENDNASLNFLQWFVTEQVEEESNADGVIQQLKLASGAPGAMFMIDRELGARVYTAPPADRSNA